MTQGNIIGKKDLVYDGLNVTFLKAFLSTKILKANENTTSFDHIRKYFDSLQYGAKEAEVLLPVSFYPERDKYLNAFKKQVAKAKGTGDVDEKKADPIPWGLYVLMRTWASAEGNMLLWVWSVLQWNLMVCSVNIEPICFHNMTVFDDSIQIKYDRNKSDPTGEKTTIKHIYANPLNPFVYPFQSLHIYLCLNVSKYKDTKNIFWKVKYEKEKVSSAGYCSQLRELLNHKKDIVKNSIRLAYANAHGWRKGGATFATSGTTCPPPTPSVARRGE